MAKEKKKTPLPQGSIMYELGYIYYEDIPKYHIDGVVCSEWQWKQHVANAEAAKEKWLKSPLLKKIGKEMLENNKKTNEPKENKES